MPRPIAAAALLLLLTACVATPPQGRTPYVPTPGMEAVLRELDPLKIRPVEDLSPTDAREQPTLQDAARAVKNVHGLPLAEQSVPVVTDLEVTGAAGTLPARLYRPEQARNTPLVLYFPDGGWVIGDLDRADATARALQAGTGAIVLSVQYRQAPEHRFPAAHDDAIAAYAWARTHARELGADPTRIALAGAGAGGNLVLATAIAARDRAEPQPVHLLLINPIADTDLDTISMQENPRPRPLSRAGVRWYVRQYASDAEDRDIQTQADPRLDSRRASLRHLASTTIVLAEIDPLRTGAEALAERLRTAGVRVATRLFPGTTHGFFGLGSVVPEAQAAETYAADALRAAFTRPQR